MGLLDPHEEHGKAKTLESLKDKAEKHSSPEQLDKVSQLNQHSDS